MRQHVARPIHLLPLRYRWNRTFARHERGTLDERVLVYVARAVRKHLANRNDDDKLRLRELRRNGFGWHYACCAVYAQPFRRSEIDEQHSDMAVRGDVAHRQKHAIAVVTRKSQRPRVQHSNEAGIAAFVRTARLAA